MKHVKILMCALAVLTLASAVSAQAPPVLQPGPEHAVLKSDVGTWDATVEMITPPGTPAPTR
jgi:hypothetical protein